MTVMRRCMAYILVAVLFCGILAALAAGAPGSADDPAVRQSYLLGTFTEKMLDEAKNRTMAAIEEQGGGQTAKYELVKETLYKLLGAKAVTPQLITAINLKMGNQIADGKGKYITVAGDAGQRMTVTQGTLVILHQGAAKLAGAATDLTDGKELAAGTVVQPRHELFFENSGLIDFTMMSTVQLDGGYTLPPPYVAQYSDLAAALGAMGLLLGDGTKGYMLERDATRIEGLVLMIRMIGDDAAAQSYAGSHPLTDIPSWADRYVAYAYSMGWVQGVGGNRYAPDDLMDSRQFMTLLLRAMEYDNNLFSWDASLDFAVQKGILLYSERTALLAQCKRDQLVYMSYYALDGLCQGGYTLAQKLVSKGAVSSERILLARSGITRVRQ